MSLNWNITKVKNYKELHSDELWPRTDALIWLTMIIGMSEIKESNVEEFYGRVHLTELLGGSQFMKNGKPAYITLEDIQRRVGLGTNVSTKTRTQFNKYITDFYWKYDVPKQSK